jgi:hypothetical protein
MNFSTFTSDIEPKSSVISQNISKKYKTDTIVCKKNVSRTKFSKPEKNVECNEAQRSGT